MLGGITAAVVAADGRAARCRSRLVVALGAGAIAGGLLGAIPAVLENRLGVPLLVSSLLISYPVVALASYLVRFPLRDPGTGAAAEPGASARLPAAGVRRDRAVAR